MQYEKIVITQPLNENSPVDQAREQIWQIATDWLKKHPHVKPEDVVIRGEFEGCGDSGCLEQVAIQPEWATHEESFDSYKERRDQVKPLEGVMTNTHTTGFTNDEVQCNFIDAAKEILIEPMVEEIPYDWYNNEGGFGDIQFRYNPDPKIMWDIAYEGHRRHEESTVEWSKEFDDE